MNRTSNIFNRTSGLILVTSVAVLFSACQKVINVKLSPGASKYVVQGVITDQPGTCSVSITTTKDFSADNTFPGVSGAIVKVENGGTVYTLTETTPGTYATSAITGEPGKTYNMTAIVDGNTYTASSTMPQPVDLDSMYISKEILGDKLYVTIAYTDPGGTPNYYRWVQYLNGVKEKTIFIDDDEFTDGLTLKNQLNYNNDTDDPNRDIKIGSTVRIDMICLDSAAYKYWYSLSNEASGNGSSNSPGNPISNIKGGCLGYFSAQAVRTKTLVVKK
ncbi:MAG TPA: DUF4249 domain-containing protein [Puia sp.]